MIITTIASSNYLAHVRTLMASVAAQEPDAQRVVLIVDKPGLFDPDGEDFQVIFAEDIGIPAWTHFAFKYSLLELNTAVKPYWIEFLLAGSEQHEVVYFDPDILLLKPLSKLRQQGMASMCVLTPHLLRPLPFDGKRQTEIDILGSGVFNLGFIAVRQYGDYLRFLHWWQERLYHYCRIVPDMSLFTDQKWIDLAPCLFEGVSIWREPEANVAYWNLQERLDEWPLFFHFSGYSPTEPNVVSSHQTRFQMQDLPPRYQGLFAAYGNMLKKRGYDEVKSLPYTYATFDDRSPITPLMRRMLLELDPDGTRWPNPFDGSYQDFLLAPTDDSGLLSVYGSWITEQLGYTPQQRIEYLSLNEPAFLGRKSSRLGVNVIGYGASATGVGEVMRAASNALQNASVSRSEAFLDVLGGKTLDHTSALQKTLCAPYRVNLHCHNLDMAPQVREQLPRSLYDNYRIGYPHWELSSLPEPYQERLSWFDELWASSGFIADTLAGYTDRPIYTIPPVIDFEVLPGNREQFGLPKHVFLVLYMFDFNSVFERKNPLAAIEAFRLADLPDSLLVIKTSNMQQYPAQAQALIAAAETVGGRVLDGVINRHAVSQLLASCDAYLSLHRSEGFGLTMAEAMYLGKPVIATDYGGNTDFMTARNSYPVRYQLVELERDYGPYPQGATWAEPDTLLAAAHLTSIYERPHDPELAERLRLAQQTIQTCYTPQRIGQAMRTRLEAIYERL